MAWGRAGGRQPYLTNVSQGSGQALMQEQALLRAEGPMIVSCGSLGHFAVLEQHCAEPRLVLESKSYVGRRDGDDLDDDFLEVGGDEGWAGIGTGLTVAGAPQAFDHDEGASEHTDPEQDDSGEDSGRSEHEGEDGDEDGSDSSDESSGGEEHIEESLKSTAKSKERSKTLRSLPGNSKELPFTFPCPSSHEEFLEILEGVDQADIGTVVERIRKLHHPILGEKNQFRLQVCLPIT